MSVGFLVEFVNNTAYALTLNAKVQSGNDWASGTTARPDIDIKNYNLGRYSTSESFHEERHDYRATAPFTVTASFDNGTTITLSLDGCNSENLANDGAIPLTTFSNEYAAFQITSHAEEVGGRWTKMTIFITPKVLANKWMERLVKRNPNLTLTDITLPGTHESGTAGGNGEMGTRCQTLSINDQLHAGIRMFDLRVRPYESEKDLGIFHSRYTQHLWLGKDVLPVIAGFLESNPNECVILLVNRAVDSDPSYDELLRDILIGNPAKGIPPGVAPNKLYDADNATNLKLTDLKGCVVLMRRDPEATFGIKVQGLKNDQADQSLKVGGELMRVQDAYEYSQVSGGAIAEAKWPNVKALLDVAKQTNSVWFVNFTSASHSPPTLNAYPLDISSGAWGVNARLSRYLATQPLFKGRLGCILMDGPESPANSMVCQLLIAMNDQL